MTGELCALLSADLADLLHVALVAHEYFADAGVCEALDLVHPLPHVVERIPVGHVVDYDYAMCAPVITTCECAEPLLACGVPLKVFSEAFHLQSGASPLARQA